MAGRAPAPPPEGLEIRRYRDDDESRALEVLQGAFGAWPVSMPSIDAAEFFRWKHLECPWGRSMMVVADCGDGPIGFYAWLPYRLAVGERIVFARRGTDLGVHPGYRGQGIAARLLDAGSRLLRPEAAFSFGNPNEKSRSGALRLDRRSAGQARRHVRPVRPFRGLHRRRLAAEGEGSLLPGVVAENAAEALADRDAVASLLAGGDRPADRLRVAKDPDYLAWRYGDLPGYHALREESGGRLRGLVLFRVEVVGKSATTRVCELLVERGDLRSARRLLRAAVRSAVVDHALCSFPRGSGELRAALQCGFLPTPGGETLLVYPLASLEPDPTDRRSWALTYGDVELL
jgi:GNAT superfamily N-acetyltransferase